MDEEIESSKRGIEEKMIYRFTVHTFEHTLQTYGMELYSSLHKSCKKKDEQKFIAAKDTMRSSNLFPKLF